MVDNMYSLSSMENPVPSPYFDPNEKPKKPQPAVAKQPLSRDQRNTPEHIVRTIQMMEWVETFKKSFGLKAVFMCAITNEKHTPSDMCESECDHYDRIVFNQRFSDKDLEELSDHIRLHLG